MKRSRVAVKNHCPRFIGKHIEQLFGISTHQIIGENQLEFAGNKKPPFEAVYPVDKNEVFDIGV